MTETTRRAKWICGNLEFELIALEHGNILCLHKKMSEIKNKIKLFEDRKVRTLWDEEAEKWWFSVVDIAAILTEQTL